MRRYLPIEYKEKARLLRKQQESIGAIAQQLGVSKSTVHLWVSTMEGAKQYARIGKEHWIKHIQPLGAVGQRKKRERKIEEIRNITLNEMNYIELSMHMKKAMLAALYWAEGSKGRGMLTFTNTDPRLMKLFITLLRQTYVIDERKFRVRLYLHWYHNEKNIKQYWSNILQIPLSQFNKVHRKKRNINKRFRKNIGGICFLRYNSDYLREQVLQYAYALGEKMTGKVVHP